MKSQTEEQKTNETKKPRFKIEKLEERIAPAKGGIPGPPDGGGNDNNHRFCHLDRHCRRGA